MVSEKTKAAKNLPNRKKTSSKYRANESRVELAQTMPSAADIMQHRTEAFDTLYIGCETVCANEGRAELVPAMPSAAKLGALVHKFPFHDSFSLSVSGVS